MSCVIVQLSGKVFGKLTVNRLIGPDKHGAMMWLCTCECGNVKPVSGNSLRTGKTKSCGCSMGITTHGQTNTKTYRSWAAMIQRCTNINNLRYKDYGGRGITICTSWLSFEKFYEDMGDKPAGKTLDRRNNSLGYSKRNCTWSTPKEQAQNRRPKGSSKIRL